jgi:hypothetical protein
VTPFRVLDLACGAGLVRVAVARRVPTRAIHYTGIDSTRIGLHSIDSLTRVAGSPSDVHLLQPRLTERFIHSQLDLHDAKALATQLGALLGRQHFDEIHMHLLHPSRNGRQPAGPQVMRAIARYLRPGGRLYHLFQNSSPLFDFDPEAIRPTREGTCPPGTLGSVRLGDEQRFREGASKGGLVLDRYGCRWEGRMSRDQGGSKAANPRKWMTRRFAGTEPDPRTAVTYERLAEQYSRFSVYASHFVILRKRKRSTAARRRPKPGGRRRGTAKTGGRGR